MGTIDEHILPPTKLVIEPGMQIHSGQVSADRNSRWNEFSKPPKEALKQIASGRLRGMTDINPQWRYKAMDEVFGQCGVGWRFEITSLRRIPCENGEVLVFVRINLYTKDDNQEWSEPIPGLGGSRMTFKEKDGLYHSDECEKMALTDALSVAMKMIGVGSEIYEGRWNGSKYSSEVVKETTQNSLSIDAAIEKRLSGSLTLSSLQHEWSKLTLEQRNVHADIKDKVKERLTNAGVSPA